MSYSHFAVPQALEYYENDEFDLGQHDHFDLDLSPQFYGNWTTDLEQDTSIDDYALSPLAYEVDWLSNPTTPYGLASPSSPFPYPLSSGADALNGASSYFNESQSPASPSAQTVYSATTSSSGKAPTATRKKKAAPEFHCLFAPCQYHTRRRDDLRRHINALHVPTDERFDCEVAGCRRVGARAFTRRDKMVEHMRECHKCDIPKVVKGGRRRKSEV